MEKEKEINKFKEKKYSIFHFLFDLLLFSIGLFIVILPVLEFVVSTIFQFSETHYTLYLDLRVLFFTISGIYSSIIGIIIYSKAFNRKKIE